MSSSLRRRIATLFLSLLLVPVIVLPATAHTSLSSSIPAAGQSLQEFPQVIELVFSEPLLTIGGDGTNYFELLGPEGDFIALGTIEVDGAEVRAQVLGADFEPGSYRIAYRVVAGDGHVIRGEIAFTYSASIDIDAKAPSSVSVDGKSGDPAVLVLAALIVITASVIVVLLLRSDPTSRESSDQG
jgi:methionine-rich copper-binding protein CopC